MKPMVFKIRTEHHPQRCELCHQSDQFDPETGFCARCSEAYSGEHHPQLTSHEFQLIQTYQAKLKVKRFLAVCTGLIGAAFYLFCAYNYVKVLSWPFIVDIGVMIAFAIGGRLIWFFPPQCPNCHQSVPIHDPKIKEGESLLCTHCGLRLS